jgi:hypothetical protein
MIQQGPCPHTFWVASFTDWVLNNVQVIYALGAPVLRGIAGPIASPADLLLTVVISLVPGEYFTTISGAMTSSGSPPARVASLTFTTNRRSFGSYGVPSTDKPFEVQGPVYAFHGAVARDSISPTLSAIGFWKVSLAN